MYTCLDPVRLPHLHYIPMRLNVFDLGTRSETRSDSELAFTLEIGFSFARKRIDHIGRPAIANFTCVPSPDVDPPLPELTPRPWYF